LPVEKKSAQFSGVAKKRAASLGVRVRFWGVPGVTAGPTNGGNEIREGGGGLAQGTPGPQICVGAWRFCKKKGRIDSPGGKNRCVCSVGDRVYRTRLVGDREEKRGGGGSQMVSGGKGAC